MLRAELLAHGGEQPLPVLSGELLPIQNVAGYVRKLLPHDPADPVLR